MRLTERLASRLWRTYVRAGALKERALRGIRPSRMPFVPYSWSLNARQCPCDVHFCEFLEEREIRGRSIFHFGSGGHHLVGVRNRRGGLNNDILAVTLSPREHASYVSRVIRERQIGVHYKVLFADIYTLSMNSLPAFDVVTLFHLCEFTPESGAGRASDETVLRRFCSRIGPGGSMLFYRGSYGYPRLAPMIDWMVDEGRLSFVEEYRSLVVYRAGTRATATE
jgi:hypothetical protein